MNDSIFLPGLITQLIFPEVRRESGATLEKVEFACRSGFYRAVEIAEVSDSGERRHIREAVKECGLSLIYWVSLLQMESGLSISSPNESTRREAVDLLLPHMAFAGECGAGSIGFVSCRDPGVGFRGDGLKSLRQSVRELAGEARAHGIGCLELETMDREAHKKHLLGPTVEALEFIEGVREEVPGLKLVFDTSHVRLLGEDVLDSLGAAASFTSRIHLANCVHDPSHPGFGDHHIPPGPPGYLDEAMMVSILSQALSLRMFDPGSWVVVSVESAGSGGRASWDLEEQLREILLSVMEEVSGVR